MKVESTAAVTTSASTADESTSLAEGTSQQADIVTTADARQAAATTLTPRQSTETITSETPEPLYTTAEETTEADTTISASTQITTGEK